MSIAFVQSTDATVNAGASSYTITLTGVAAGDALVLPLTYNSATAIPQTITDTSSNSWQLSTTGGTQNPPLAVNSTIGQVALVAYALSVAASASLVVTVSFASSMSLFGGGALAEYSGIGSETAGVAVTGTGTNPITFSSVTIPSGGLFVGVVGCQFGQGGVSPNSPLGAMPNDSGSYSAYGSPPAGSYAASWANTNTRAYAGAGVVFAPAAAAAAATPAPLVVPSLAAIQAASW